MLTRRQSLCSLLLAAAETPPRPRKLWSGAQATHLGAPSPDGTFLTMVDPQSGDLALRDIATGAVRRLTRNAPAAPTFAYFSIVSRDSKWIAYAWFNEERFYELRLISAEGGEPRVLQKNPERPFIQPCAFSADGKRILTLFFRSDNISQITLVSTTDGGVQVLKSLDWVYPNKMDFSPDGRWIVYDDPLQEGQSARGLFLLAADGTARRPAFTPQMNEVFPLFTPDGKSLAYLSTRNGATSLWLQPLGQGKPLLAVANIGRALPLGFTGNGDYYYALRSGQSEVWVASLDPTPTNPRPLFPASGPPEWSADGKRIAALARAGNENFGQDAHVILIADLTSNKTTTVSPRLATIDHLRWSPDEKQFLAGGSDRHGQRGLYLIDAQTAAVRPVVRIPASTYQGFEGVWLPDSHSICYIHPDEASIALQSLEGAPRTLHRAAAGSRLHDLAISRDGRTVAFAMNHAGSESLLVLSLAGGLPRQLTSVRGGSINGLEFHPDGQSLLASTPTDPPALWLIPLAGGSPQKLSWNLGQQGPLRFHPAQRHIAYTAGKTQTEIWVIERLVHAPHHQR